jgi:hypothetical protein
MIRWQDQTLNGGRDAPEEKRGDCIRACIASIIDVPIDTLPNPHGDDWVEEWAIALGPLGFILVDISIDYYFPIGYWIARVPSLNLPGCYHVVVAQGNKLVHDPALNNKYTDETWAGGAAASGGQIITVYDPAEIKRLIPSDFIPEGEDNVSS